MNDQSLLQQFRERGCWPFQAEFAVDFLNEDGSTFHLLTGPVVAGKLFVTAVLIDYMVSERQANRILVLAPAPLLSVLQQKLTELTVPADIIDRRRFRELVDGVAVGENPWPRDVVCILSLDFAKQEDLAESLCDVYWDAVVIDEAHLLSGAQRAMLLKRLLSANAVKRLLLATATPLPALAPLIQPTGDDEPLVPDIRLTNWHRNDLADWDGKTLSRAGVNWEVIRHRRGADEEHFLRKFQDEIGELYRASGDYSFLVETLKQRASSSIFALEQTCQRLHHTLRYSLDLAALDVQITEEGTAEREQTESGAFVWRDRNAGLQIVTEWLSDLENVISDDSDTFLRVLSEIINSSAENASRPCVISSYANTLAYLHSALAEAAICETYLVTGALSFSERTEQIERYLRQGGILLGSDAVLTEGVDLSQVTHVFHYDIPSNPNRIEQRRGRFDRFGRTVPCVMFLFQDDTDALPYEKHLAQTVAKADPELLIDEQRFETAVTDTEQGADPENDTPQ